MSAPFSWDPDRYLAFSEERGRPFADLIARIGAEDPRTRRRPRLRGRQPDRAARPALARRSRARGGLQRGDGPGRAVGCRVEFTVGDIREWPEPGDPIAGAVDVLVSNAALQWVPDHLDLLPGLVHAIAPRGWLAIQVPGNFDEPSHTIRRELAAEPAYAGHTAGVAVPEAHDAETYLRVLRDLGCEVDAWETTYLHVLDGPDPVFRWVSGTGARPTLEALPPDLRADFEEEFKARLREAYPERAGVVVLPFRRVFVVARAG